MWSCRMCYIPERGCSPFLIVNLPSDITSASTKAMSFILKFLIMRRYLFCITTFVLFVKSPLPSYFLMISVHLFRDGTGVSALISTSNVRMHSSSGLHDHVRQTLLQMITAKVSQNYAIINMYVCTIVYNNHNALWSGWTMTSPCFL